MQALPAITPKRFLFGSESIIHICRVVSRVLPDGGAKLLRCYLATRRTQPQYLRFPFLATWHGDRIL